MTIALKINVYGRDRHAVGPYGHLVVGLRAAELEQARQLRALADYAELHARMPERLSANRNQFED